jgi:hypothetical protein
MTEKPKWTGMSRAVMSVAVALASSNAMAATAVTQDRDNEIRNFWQKSATAVCVPALPGPKSCTFVYPAVPKGQRLLISYISCLITNTVPVGVTVKLYAGSNANVFVPFYAAGIGDSATDNQHFSINTATRFYVNSADSPIISISGTSPFVGASTCFISGETATVP